jgi:cell wall-associated NlpC family hydrolase
MDRRLWPATSKVAHSSLRGRLDGVAFTDGENGEIAVPLANLCAAPNGALDRQLLLGEGFCILERSDSHAFGFARKDGYCGWLKLADLCSISAKSHWLAAPSHLYPQPVVQAPPIMALPMGARVQVTGVSGNFAQTPLGFIPLPHLRALGDWAQDAVTVAETFLGCPYLWGGNSHAGIDCSGLIQAALMACGMACPSDSDLQQSLGVGLPTDTPFMRGDLLFWRGHVAMVADSARLIHANGHTMSVAFEDITSCIARIKAAGGGGVTHLRRMS